MDIYPNTDNLGSALWLMLLGMIGIFVVMAIIFGVVVLLNKTTSENKNKKDKKGGKQSH